MAKRKITLEFELDEDIAQLAESTRLLLQPEKVFRAVLESPLDSPYLTTEYIVPEIKNATVHISGCVNLLLWRYGQLSDDQRMTYLTQIAERSYQIDSIMTSLRDLYLLRTSYRGRLELLEVTTIIQESIKKLQERFTGKNITVEFEKSVLTIPLKGDIFWLQRLFHYLLTNAFVYTPNGGKITLLLSHLPQQYHLVIQDTGIGIHTDDLSRVFEDYYMGFKALKILNSDSNEILQQAQLAGRLGLGLTIAKKIVDLHRGDIWIESTLGEGTTVHITLPTDQSPQIAPPP